MARSRARKARRKAYSRHRRQHSRVSGVDRYRRLEQKAYSRHRQQHSRGQDTLEETHPIQEDKAQKQDALDYAVSGGHFESNRRKH